MNVVQFFGPWDWGVLMVFVILSQFLGRLLFFRKK
jgi:hypothetical protein